MPFQDTELCSYLQSKNVNVKELQQIMERAMLRLDLKTSNNMVLRVIKIVTTFFHTSIQSLFVQYLNFLVSEDSSY